GVLASVQNGKCDFASCGITITDERAEIVLFGMPILYSGNTAAVLKQKDASSTASAASGSASLQDLNGKRIGVQTGTTFDEIVLETLPDAKVSYFNSYPDMAAALEANKIDAFPGDEPVIRLMAAENNKLAVLEERMDDFDFGIALPKTENGEKLLAEINAWLASIKKNGELEQIIKNWTDGPESEKSVPNYASFPAPNGVLTLATEGAYAPMNYYRGDEVVGLEIDLIARFCEANGYGLKVVPMLFDGILPAIQSGKADFAAAGLTITEERKESVYFSDPYYTGGTVMAILKSKAAAPAQQTANMGVTSIDDLANARIGVQTGTICGALVESRLPNAQVYYYNTVTDVLAALNAGKLDAGCMDEPMLRFLKIENPQINILDELLDKSNLAAVFPKTEAGQALCSQYSEFLEKLWEDGTMKEIDAVWFGEDDGKRTVIDFASLPATNGTLRMAADLSMVPFTYMKDNKIVGYDVDVAARFCREYGYALEIVPMDFGGILPSVQSGKCEFASSCITVTEERAESVLFSSPNYYGGIAVGVLDDGNSAIQATGTVRWQDYNGKRLGVLVGPLMEDAAKEYFPDSEYLLFNSYPDCIAALLSGKIDAYLGDELGAFAVHAENLEIDYIHDRITQNNYAFAFRKNDPKSAALCAELNDFLAISRENGTMEDLENIWYGIDEERKVVDMSDLTGENGTIRVVTTSTDMPFSYIKDGKNVGYDIDLVVRFCRDRGYALELGDVAFDGRIPAIQSGKYDFTTDMNVTPEREEQVLFSDPTGYGGIVLVVRSSDLGESTVSEAGVYTSVSQLDGKRIGVQSGTNFDAMVQENLPSAQIDYYIGKADLVAALTGKKVEAFAVDEPVAQILMHEDERLTYLHEYLDDYVFAFAFAKNEAGKALKDQFNAFLEQLPDGTLDALAAKWFDEDEDAKPMPDITALKAENGTLRLATESGYAPFEYIRDGQVVGYDMELAALFCEANGYGLEIVDMNFDAILPAIQTGKCDFAAAGIGVTPERAESVLFSEPNFTGGMVLVVLKTEAQPTAQTAETTIFSSQAESFWDGIVSSFNKTFLRENRWELFGNGVLTTLLITVLSILFGTALGFLVFMLCRNGNIVANGVTRFSMWLVQGMPMVVLLMILYYIIFGSVAISGIFVAVIGFTLAFGAAVFGLLKMGVGAIDRGQYEAAYA
ncbi:MAG: transporter substrate-binding domain-containing protein, partial [Clostridia bacterium]|nr:transporter substrate-binding domain-containing protein [Clostridia bacterium]